MKKNETDVGIARAFANIRRKLAQGGSGLEGALQTTPEVLLAVLTPERVRLYRLVQARREVPSVDDLARLLRRDATRVSRDIVALEAIGLLTTTRDGKSKRIVANTRPIVLM